MPHPSHASFQPHVAGLSYLAALLLLIGRFRKVPVAAEPQLAGASKSRPPWISISHGPVSKKIVLLLYNTSASLPAQARQFWPRQAHCAGSNISSKRNACTLLETTDSPAMEAAQMLARLRYI
jgi:hypothetical protein